MRGGVPHGTIHCDFSNASVTTMLPLLPPKVNVGCWTRELKQDFKVFESSAPVRWDTKHALVHEPSLRDKEHGLQFIFRKVTSWKAINLPGMKHGWKPLSHM